MKNNFELQLNNHETLSKEELHKKLELAYGKRQALLKEEAKYYDKDDLQTYANVRNHFRGDEDRIALYFNVEEDESYQDMADNFAKFKDFRENKLGPLEKEIQEIGGRLRAIRRKEREEEQVIKDIELEEKFDKEKNELTTQLYEALDKIHSEIPSIAKELGMTTKVAIETYLPELSSRNRLLENYIEEAEKAKYSSDLYSIRENMKGWNIEL